MSGCGAQSRLLAIACLVAGLQGQEPPLLERHGHRAHLIGDTVYVVGGSAREERDHGTREVLAWSPGEAQWTARAPMALGRTFFGSSVIDGFLYAVGTTIERYDPAADAWSTVYDDGELPRSHHVVAAFRGRLHVLGGIPDDRSGHVVFDPATGMVSAATPPPGFAPGDHLHVFAVVGDRLHCVGGLGAAPSGHAAFDGERWSACAPPPVALHAKFAVVAVVGHRLFVFAEAASLCYDAEADAWTEITRSPHWLVMPAAVVRDGAIEIVGGRRVRGGGYGAGSYDPARNRWQLQPAPSKPRAKTERMARPRSVGYSGPVACEPHTVTNIGDGRES